MRTRLRTPASPLAILLLAVVFAPWPATAQSAFPLGSFTTARVPDGGAAEFVFQAPGAGFLTVVVRSTAGEDVTLSVADEDYQSLPGADSDIDLGGDVGAEQLVAIIPHQGTFRVLVETFGGGGAGVQVGGTFLASDLVHAEPDPDGRPGTATALEVGASHEDSIEPSAGDPWDWYRITASADGALTVLTRVDGDGDLRLEIFHEGSYREAANSSDQDIDGVLGNESLTWDVKAGDTVYIRVVPALGGGERVPYRIASGLIPG